MSGVRPLNERLRLEAFYAEKNDEELLSLIVDYQNLTEVAQGALHDELNKRRLWSDRPNQEPETSTKPLKDRENFSGVLHKGGFLLLNLTTAVFGTAIVESPFDHLYHPRTIGAVLFKAELLPIAGAAHELMTKKNRDELSTIVVETFRRFAYDAAA